MNNKLLALLIFVSVNLPVFSVVPQFMKISNSPTINNFDDSIKLLDKVNNLESINSSLNTAIQQDLDSKISNLKLRKKGGGITSVPFLGSYLLNIQGLQLNFDIIDGSISKSGNGFFEYVIYDSEGNLFDHSQGVVNNFVSSFMTVNVSGSMLYNLRISSGSSYGGYGLMLVNVFAENCLDLSNNGVLEIGEAYECTYTGSEIFPLNISLARKAGY